MRLRDVFALQNALTQLDAVSKATSEPIFSFKGGVRLSLTTKVRAVREAAATYAEARKKLEQEMKITSKTQAEDPETWSKYDATLGEMLDADIPIKLGAKIRTEDLDLDRNPFTSTLLIALDPILIPPRDAP